MIVSVKILNGQESSLAVSPYSQITEVKQLIYTLMSITPTDQKLLFRGKALLDDKFIKDYDIHDGARLTLVVRKPGQPAEVSSRLASQHGAWDALRTFLLRHFRERDSELVCAEFRKNFEKRLDELSLDDVEKLAAAKLASRQHQ